MGPEYKEKMFHVHTNHPSYIMCYLVHIYSIERILTIITYDKGQLISNVLTINNYKKGLILYGRIARTSKVDDFTSICY
jgi:hypothetical protein